MKGLLRLKLGLKKQIVLSIKSEINPFVFEQKNDAKPLHQRDFPSAVNQQ